MRLGVGFAVRRSSPDVTCFPTALAPMSGSKKPIGLIARVGYVVALGRDAMTS